MRDIYQGYSKIIIKLDDKEKTIINLKLWKAFESKKDITYSLSDDYSFGSLVKDEDLKCFAEFLGINTFSDSWAKKEALTISEEEMSNCFGDTYSVYKFHYTTKTVEGHTLNTIPFEPIDFYLKE